MQAPLSKCRNVETSVLVSREVAGMNWSGVSTSTSFFTPKFIKIMLDEMCTVL